MKTGQLAKIIYLDAKEVIYEYNAASQLVKVIDWAGRETNYEYDPNARLKTVIRPNGTKMTRLYDDAGQLLQQKDVVVSTGEILSQFDFTYDATGDIVQEQMLPEPEIEVEPLEMTYSAANRLATYDEKALKFDADGNMTKGPLSGSLTNFAFDSRNRLISAGNTTYRYDAENQRVGVSVDGQETRYVVNSQPALSQVLVRTQPDGTQTYYVYGLGLLGQEQDGEYLTYHFDLRGSTVALTDASGQVLERFQYSPYGLLLSGDASKTPFLFNGMYGVMTDGNGLYYMRARFYSPQIRRFVNQDILLGNIEQGQTLNRYAFVTGRPVSYIDPWGLVSIKNQISTESNSTIQCNGKGGVEVIMGETVSHTCGLFKCIKIHEESHVEYVVERAPNICIGQPKGAGIGLTPSERLETECVAIEEERTCLENELYFSGRNFLSYLYCKYYHVKW